MTKFKNMFTVGMTAVLAMTVLSACGTDTKQEETTGGDKAASKGKIVMGTSADYPPYEFHSTASGSDEIKGFDIDIAKHIATKLGYELEIKDMEFKGLIPAIQSKAVDFVMAGMTPTAERKQTTDFTDIYYEAKNTIVAKKGANLKTEADLKGKKVGVQTGSIQEGDAKKMEGVTVVQLGKVNAIIEEVKVGRVDAAIVEDTVAKGFIEKNKELEFNTIPNKGESGSAIAFPKGSDKTAEFNKVLKEMKDSGELDKLVKKWFEDQSAAK